MSIIRKYHNHTLQTNPQYHEEEPQNITVSKHQEDQQSKATSSLFPIKMIAKLERIQSTEQQNMEQTQNPTMVATKQCINNNRTTALEQTAA